MNAVAKLVAPIQNAAFRPGQKTIRLSHSRKQVMVTCGRMYKYRYVDRLEPIIKSSNLGFGGAMHGAAAGYLTAQAFGSEIEPLPLFEREWEEFTAKPVSYSSLWSEEKLRATGKALLAKFVDDWKARGWVAVLDVDGLPIVERELEFQLPNGIIYVVIIDAVVRTPDGKILVLDFKTPSQPALESFASVSDQLLGYQIAINAHAQTLGIDKVDGLVFYELVKRPIPKTNKGEGPKIHVEEPAPARPNADVEEWIDEIGFVVNDIRAKRFSRRPMDSYNSPCEMCDFKKICHEGVDNNLRVRPKHTDKEKEDPIQLVVF